jgi:Icc-related predicted phosphoesterase
MRLVAISDTHNQALRKLPDGDVLIHAGDATNMGSLSEIQQFAKWFGRMPHKYKLFTPGNHDISFQDNEPLARRITTDVGVTVLIDQSFVIDGVKFYGSPWQPEFCDWSYNLPRGRELAAKWDLIPKDVNVLITHGPPRGILDMVGRRGDIGCEDLRTAVMKRKKLKAHIFGHIHYSYGMVNDGIRRFYNAAICDERYQPVNAPWEIDII